MATPTPAPAIEPLTLLPGEPSGMILDLVHGDLTAGFVLLDWLAERHEPHRRLQADLLRASLGDLVQTARQQIYRRQPGSHQNTDPMPLPNTTSWSDRDAWQSFVSQILGTFALDVYAADDLIRFVGAALLPLPADENGEVSPRERTREVRPPAEASRLADGEWLFDGGR